MTDDRRLTLLLYYITDRSQFPGDETLAALDCSKQSREAARCGVDYIQLREKDLSATNWKLWPAKQSSI